MSSGLGTKSLNNEEWILRHTLEELAKNIVDQSNQVFRVLVLRQ